MSANMLEWKRQLRVLQRQVDICRGLQPRGKTDLTPVQVATLHQATRDAEDALSLHYSKLKRR